VAKNSWIAKTARPPRYSTRRIRRCSICGRRRSFYRRFGLCRICFRSLALKGLIPGVIKASW